jgi:hypothetical protein
MSSSSNVSVPVAEPEVPDVEPEVEVPIAPVVVTRAEALLTVGEVPEPDEYEEDYEAYLEAEAARRAAWIYG